MFSTQWAAVVAATSLACGLFSPLAQAQDLTVYLVRHAEKDVQQKSDPRLTQTGQQRAERWTRVFKYTPISAVYSTDTRRTRDTAAPLANAKNLDVTLYNVGTLEAAKLMELHDGGVVFIVGHSNTIPDLVNRLIGQQRYEELDESEYDDLFRVSLSGSSSTGQSERLQLPLD